MLIHPAMIDSEAKSTIIRYQCAIRRVPGIPNTPGLPLQDLDSESGQLSAQIAFLMSKCEQGLLHNRASYQLS